MHENPPTCSLAYLILTRKFSTWVYWSVLPILSKQVAQFISCGDIGCFYFSWEYTSSTIPFACMISRFQSNQGKRKGIDFHVLACIVCLLLTFSRSIYFIKCPVFHFLNLHGSILNLVYSYLKIRRQDQNLGAVILKVFLF